jgi:hemerythrin-like domain-containing protein
VGVDALALLREDHLAVLAMLDTLVRTPDDGRPATPNDLAARRQVATDLVMAESAHEALEEEFFWPSVRHWLPEGNELAAPALEQEQSAKQLLAELDKLDAGDPTFERLLSRIIDDARAHIRYEETEVWPVVRDRIARSELEELGRKMAAARKVAPTRPHPRTPPKPGVLKTVGIAAAAMDRLRDVATRRRATGVIALRPPGRAGATDRYRGDQTTGRDRRDQPGALTRALVGVVTLVLVVVAVRRRRAPRRSRSREPSRPSRVAPVSH